MDVARGPIRDLESFDRGIRVIYLQAFGILEVIVFLEIDQTAMNPLDEVGE